MVRRQDRIRNIVALGLAVAWLVGAGQTAQAGSDLVAETYAELDQLRGEKLAQLREYLDRVQDRAQAAAEDDLLGEFLQIKAQFEQLRRQSPPPPAAVDAMLEAERQVRLRYLERYLTFYDILFVTPEGDVVHTIRNEADHRRNLFLPPLNGTALVQRLRQGQQHGFVDYEYYAASDEASAFFVEPVRRGGEGVGWLILQCTVDKLNRIFDRGIDLGETGEVFLVSRGRLMLTNSRFQAANSILAQHLSEANISAKFAEGQGNKIVTDYRGERALTSFEVVPVLGTQWLLIAKIDEDEVISRAWRRASLEPALLAAVAAQAPADAPMPEQVPAIRVDLDEFHRAEPGDRLLTYGVSTCTAVMVGRPGRFAYLGHASPYDRLYGDGNTDLVAHMLKQIRQFEVYPSELRELVAVVVAPHLDSAHGSIERLLAAGLFLDQITIVHDPDARSGDVWHDPASGKTWVHWLGPDDRERWVMAGDVVSLGDLAAEILDSPAAVRRADTEGRHF
jgi:hypothetical protein